MGLRIPVGQMANESFAVGARLIGLGRVFGFGAAEYGAPILARGKSIGVIDSVTALMTHQLLAPLRRSPLHFQHLPMLQRLQTRMRKIKRNGNGRNSGR